MILNLGTLKNNKFSIIHLLYCGILMLSMAGCGTRAPVKKLPVHLAYASKQMEKGLGWYQKGCYRHAKPFFLKAHERFSALDQQSEVAMSLNNLANVHRLLGDMTRAHLFYDKAIHIYNNLGDKPSKVRVLTNKAAAYISLNQLTDAGKVLDQAETIAKKHHINPIWIHNHRGVLFTRKKKYQTAENSLKKALARIDPEQPSQVANVNFAMGNLLMESEKLNEALPCFEKALLSDQKQGYYKGIADDLKFLGLTHLKLMHPETAFNYLERSINVYSLLGKNNEVANILKKIENIKEKKNLSLDVTAIFIHKWLNEGPLEPLCPQ